MGTSDAHKSLYHNSKQYKHYDTDKLVTPDNYNPNNYDYNQIYVYDVTGKKVVKGTGYTDLGKSIVAQPKGHSHTHTGHHVHAIVGGKKHHPEDAFGTTGLGDVIKGAGSSGPIPINPYVQTIAYTPGVPYKSPTVFKAA